MQRYRRHDIREGVAIPTRRRVLIGCLLGRLFVEPSLSWRPAGLRQGGEQSLPKRGKVCGNLRPTQSAFQIAPVTIAPCLRNGRLALVESEVETAVLKQPFQFLGALLGAIEGRIHTSVLHPSLVETRCSSLTAERGCGRKRMKLVEPKVLRQGSGHADSHGVHQQYTIRHARLQDDAARRAWPMIRRTLVTVRRPASGSRRSATAAPAARTGGRRAVRTPE